jgi:hypothetical protein
VPFTPWFSCVHEAPPSRLFRVPRLEPAYTVEEALGSTRTVKTVVSAAVPLAGRQLAPESVLLRIPASSVPA